MTDQLERLFADLRAETLPTVRPPGAGAVRRTVRRRRLASAGAAALAVAGLLTVGMQRGPVSTPAASLTELASQVVGLDNTIGRGDTLELPGTEDVVSTQHLIGGTYLTKVACAGPGGGVTMFFGSVGVAVPCTTPAQLVPTVVRVANPGQAVEVRAVPDGEAGGKSVVAYQMELSHQDGERLAGAAKKLLPETTAASTEGLLVGADTLNSNEARPGRYRLVYSCVGAGSVRYSVDLIENGNLTPLLRTQLACGPSGATGSDYFTVSTTGAEPVEVTMTPDATASGQVAAAVGLLQAG